MLSIQRSNTFCHHFILFSHFTSFQRTCFVQWTLVFLIPLHLFIPPFLSHSMGSIFCLYQANCWYVPDSSFYRNLGDLSTKFYTNWREKSTLLFFVLFAGFRVPNLIALPPLLSAHSRQRRKSGDDLLTVAAAAAVAANAPGSNPVSGSAFVASSRRDPNGQSGGFFDSFRPRSKSDAKPMSKSWERFVWRGHNFN